MNLEHRNAGKTGSPQQYSPRPWSGLDDEIHALDGALGGTLHSVLDGQRSSSAKPA